MTTLFDARSNPYQGQLDAIGNESVTDPRTAGATLAAASAEVFMDLNGKAVAVFEIRAGANSATYVFEGSVDGSNYYPIPARPLPGSLIAGAAMPEAVILSQVVTTSVAAAYALSATGYRRVRCRVSAYTSGSAVVTGRATIADYAIIAQPYPALQATSVQGVAATLATLTLATPPAGMFLYLSSLKIMRAGAAALAGTAVLAITTTNLLSLAWTVGNASAAGGTQTDVDFQPAQPLKVGTPASVSSVTMPAPGAGVLWSAQATYYFGV